MFTCLRNVTNRVRGKRTYTQQNRGNSQTMHLTDLNCFFSIQVHLGVGLNVQWTRRLNTFQSLLAFLSAPSYPQVGWHQACRESSWVCGKFTVDWASFPGRMLCGQVPSYVRMVCPSLMLHAKRLSI